MAPGRREALALAAAGVASAVAGFLVGPMLLQTGEEKVLREASLVDLAGKRRKLTEWQGRVLVCNFWATWCAPCREEIPLLVAASEKYARDGVDIVGIAVDNAANVVEFSRTFMISYTILLLDANGPDLMRELGNSSGGLPYTVFLDRQGRPANRKLGALKQAELDAILGRLASA